ncbi:PREDICTED: uncharacterized protein LOC107327426 [Acropora digitifera]|uniref:uncharacterized protein LOC107327426 n=1 Tax=Acropora digitifera TaxID=70779 RepID=UPI00077A7A46|nr:PREDICTED: uncharacterized protein LOC107327426 [Acropora digitifera]
MIRTAEEIALLEVGDLKTYNIQGNNTKVYFLCKRQPPENRHEAMEFAKVLAKNAGVSLLRYREAFSKDDDESKKHFDDFQARKNGAESTSPSPRKKARVVTPGLE